jgi:hypothetical protein
MTKKEIEDRFRGMLLYQSDQIDKWRIPAPVHTKYYYTFSIVQMPKQKLGGRHEGGIMIRVEGGPVSLQGWYMPDAGIERIQKIIQEITRL